MMIVSESGTAFERASGQHSAAEAVSNASNALSIQLCLRSVIEGRLARILDGLGGFGSDAPFLPFKLSPRSDSLLPSLAWTEGPAGWCGRDRKSVV